MNERVRSYLIQVARQKDKIVYYSDVVRDCNLPFDITTELGRDQLSNELGEVSDFEFHQQQPRPLLSSLVIYKDKNKNDHGEGFYRLAQSLGLGNRKKLRDELFAFAEAKRCGEFWQKDENYNKYNSIRIEPEEKIIEFFTKEDLEFFKLWQYKVYDPDNNEHVSAKNHLMDTVWEKSKYLGNEIIKKLDGFKLEARKSWSQRGWGEDSEGVSYQAAIFKPYTWIKIYRNSDNGKDIFFTFGIDAYPETEAFIYKIDCQDKRDSKLSEEQIRLCKSLIPTSAKWNEIDFEVLLNHTWESLIDTCVRFINQFLAHYDAIVASVWGKPIPPELFKNQLIKKEKPKDGFETIPETKKQFKGVEIDFQGKAKEQKDLGDAGEELVRIREIEFLKSKNLLTQAELVKIAKDGEGYDVYSFDENGQEKFIEVKTSTGDEYSPFYLSENEIAFMRLNVGSYCIYRVFNYSVENNFAEFFELSGDIESQLLMKPTQFQVLIKKDA